MKKSMLLAIISICILLLAACSTKNNDKISKSDLGKTKESNQFEIRINDLVKYKKRDAAEKKPPKNVTEVKVEVKNVDSLEYGVGALDFKAFDKSGNELPYYGYAINIGDIVGIDKTLKGNLYYATSENKISKIVYHNPVTKKNTTWKL